MTGKRVLIFVGVAVLIIVSMLLGRRLGLEEDPTALLPDGDPIIRDYRLVTSSFKVLDSMYIDIGITGDLADGEANAVLVADTLHRRMMESELFERISYRYSADRMLKFYEILTARKAGLFRETDIAEISKKLGREKIRQSIHDGWKQLIEPSGSFVKKQIRNDPLDFNSLLSDKFETLSPVSDQSQIIDGRIWSRDSRHILMIAVPKTRATDSGRSVELLKKFDGWIAEALSCAPAGSVRVSHTGGHRASLDNATTIKADVAKAMTITVIGIALLGFLFFRRKWLLLVVFVPALMGMAVAMAVFGIFAPKVSAVAIGCGAILIGISVDYGIHVLFRLDRSAGKVGDNDAWMKGLYFPVFLGALTTASGMLCLLLSDLPGQRQVGVFGALGVGGAAIFALLALPRIFKPFKTPGRHFALPLGLWAEKFLAWRKRHGMIVNAMVLLCVAVSIFGVTQLRFEGDIRKLNRLSADSRRDEECIMKVWGGFLNTSVVVRRDTMEEALRANDRISVLLRTLRDQGSIRDYSSIAPILPSLRTQRENRERWTAFWSPDRTSETRRQIIDAGKQFGFRAGTFKPFFDSITAPIAPVKVEDLKRAGLGDMLASTISRHNGQYLIASTFSPTEHSLLPELRKQIMQCQSDAIILNGRAFVEHTSALIRNGLKTLAIAAFLAMSLCLYLFFKRVELILMVFLPVLLSVLLTLGVLGLLGIPINMMNSLFIVFLFAVGIDYSIFLMTSRLDAFWGRGERQADTIGAVAICALTTMCGFGALVIADHPALFSIGLTGIIGMGASLVSGLFMVPAIAGLFFQRKASMGAPTIKMYARSALPVILLIISGFIYVCFLRLVWRLRFLRNPAARKRIARGYMHWVITSYFKSYYFTRNKRLYVGFDENTFDPPGIIISNHVAISDILLMLSAHAQTVMVVKEWVWNIPLLTPLAKDAGYILVGEGYEGIETLVSRATEHMNEGACVLIFPEGSRSRNRRMKRFHKGAFELAIRSRREIIPILITNSHLGMPPGAPWIANHCTIVHALPRITPQNAPYEEGAKDLAKYAREKMETHVHEDWRSAQKGKTFWDNIRALYNYAGPYVESYIAWKLRLDPIYKRIDDLVPQSGVIVDAGHGYGLMSNILARKSLQRRVIGVDYDERKTTIASKTAANQDNIAFQFENLLEWEPPRMDSAVLIDVLHYWPAKQQEQIIIQLIENLQPGGTVVMREGCDSPTWRHRLVDWLERFSTCIGHNKTDNGLNFQSRDFYVTVFEQHGMKLEQEFSDLGRGSNTVLVFRKGKTKNNDV